MALSLFRFLPLVRMAPAALLLSVVLLSSCGGSTTNTATTTTTTANPYALAYQKATWGAGVTVSFPSTCSMVVTSSGVPPSHSAYYLTPVSNGGTLVATTASGIQLMVTAYAGTPLSTTAKPVSGTFNICPAKATSTTATSLGAIGVITSGEALFNAYEATLTVAQGDNISYSFSSGGTTYTASFIDSCNSHAAGGMGGSSWHYHANPICWTPTVDGATGASHIIGIAIDGFPIYGGRDVSGNVVDPATLDACNGITSATPEFPTGAYHYVLPITANGAAVTTKQSSINCYAGTVNATLSAEMKKLACTMPMLLASGQVRLPDGREVSKSEAATWMRKTMPGMKMDSVQMADAPASIPGKQNKSSNEKRPLSMPGM